MPATNLASNDKVLLLDDRYIESSRGVTRTFHKPAKCADNPVFGWAGRPWRDPARGVYVMGYGYAPAARIQRSVLTDALPMISAESPDGLHWTTVPLGLRHRYTIKPGAKPEHVPNPLPRNVCGCAATGPYDLGHLGIMVQDFILHNGDGPDPDSVALGTRMGYSRDGIQWEIDFDVIPPQEVYDASSMMYDRRKKKYVLYGRYWQKADQPKPKGNCEGFRKVMYSESDDLHRWTPPKIILDVDEFDPPRTEFYYIRVMNYGLYYIGLLHIYRYGVSWGPKQETNDVQLAWSHDGEHWVRPGPTEPNLPEVTTQYMKEVGYAGDPRLGRPDFLTAGEPGEWDRFEVYSHLPIEMGDELWFYYDTQRIRHGPEVLDDNGDGALGGGVAMLRKDGFCSLDGSYSGGRVPTYGGEVETKPFLLPAGRICINAAARFGRLSVELLDETHQPIPGYTAGPIAADAVRIPVAFGQHTTLESLAGRPVRLRFRLMNARLYSFWVE